MIKQEPPNNETETPKPAISAESVLSYVVIGCFVVALLGILAAINSLSKDIGEAGIPLFASAVALGVVAYIYCHKR